MCPASSLSLSLFRGPCGAGTKSRKGALPLARRPQVAEAKDSMDIVEGNHSRPVRETPSENRMRESWSALCSPFSKCQAHTGEVAPQGLFVHLFGEAVGGIVKFFDLQQ